MQYNPPLFPFPIFLAFTSHMSSNSRLPSLCFLPFPSPPYPMLDNRDFSYSLSLILSSTLSLLSPSLPPPIVPDTVFPLLSCFLSSTHNTTTTAIIFPLFLPLPPPLIPVLVRGASLPSPPLYCSSSKPQNNTCLPSLTPFPPLLSLSPVSSIAFLLSLPPLSCPRQVIPNLTISASISCFSLPTSSFFLLPPSLLLLTSLTLSSS